MIGQRVREYRLTKGLRLKAFAAQIGISQGSLSDIENGKTRPSANTVVSIVQSTGINPAWLLIEEGEMFDRKRPAAFDPITRKVLELMDQLDESSKGDVLKYVEEKKLLAKLRRRRAVAVSDT